MILFLYNYLGVAKIRIMNYIISRDTHMLTIICNLFDLYIQTKIAITNKSQDFSPKTSHI